MAFFLFTALIKLDRKAVNSSTLAELVAWHHGHDPHTEFRIIIWGNAESEICKKTQHMLGNITQLQSYR